MPHFPVETVPCAFDELPDPYCDPTAMLAPDEFGDEEEARDRALPGGGVVLSQKELFHMLDILAAVHRCWQNGTLPETVAVPYMRYSAASGVPAGKKGAKGSAQ